jgi:aryl-alcohol dehydrogenase-like predicted oxidoreductase
LIEVSVIGFGAWAIGGRWWGGNNEKDSFEAIKVAMDSGINFIDTAPVYGKGLSESIVGRAIKGKRDKMVIATKCGLIWDKKNGMYFLDYSPGEPVYRYLGRKSIEKELEASLKRLGTDYIDVYQTHWQDPTTPIEETMTTLLNLKDKGKIRAIGVSNISISEIKEYSKFGKLNVDQENYSILDRRIEEGLLPWCSENYVSVLAYSPTSKGLLTGKLDPGRVFKGDDSRIGDPRYSPENIKKTNYLLQKFIKPVADKHNAAIGNVAVAWLLKDPIVVALCGARNRQQSEENIKAGDILLDSSDMELIIDFINNYAA